MKLMYSERLKELRVKHDLTQKMVAEILNISEITYTHYESEYYIIPIKYLSTLCDYFNVSLDYIFNFNNLNYVNIKKLDKLESGKRIKEFRKENKLTQNKLASILHVNQSTIAEYERGTNLIATPFLYTICKNYNVSADYILGKIDKLTYNNSRG